MSGTADANKGANRSARLLSAAASVNATVAVDGPCQLRGVMGYNAKATMVFLKIYALASTLAAPAASDTPVLTIPLPGSGAFALDVPGGFDFNFGMGYRITTGQADADTGVLASGDILALNLLVA
jgi:hypothetical protein